MSKRRRHKPKLVTGYYGEPTRRGLDWQPCDWCHTRCQPVRYALALICSRCRRIELYGNAKGSP